MSDRKRELNVGQLAVLAWIRDGSPEGTYRGWSHRVTARALHNRGLVTVKGHGERWSASLTDAGACYLDNGTHPKAAAEVEAATAASRPPKPTQPARGSATPRDRASRKPKKPGRVDEMMAALRAAKDHTIVVPSGEETRYRHLASAAKRFGRIPEGMLITFSPGYGGQCTMTLEPRPAWQTATLEPIPVPKRLRDPSDVVAALSASDTFQVTGDARKRALRLAEALVTAARERGLTVEARLNQAVSSDYRGGPRHDELQFRLGGDRFRVWFTQAIFQKPHEPTRREIARVRHGYLFPDFDDVPDEHLGLVLEGEGTKFWADAWRDTTEHQLEDDLAQILEEIRLRHERLDQQRLVERDRHATRMRQHEEDRARAAVKYRQQFLIDAMSTQAQRWEDAARLRRYADAVRTEAERFEGGARERALAWAEQVLTQAGRIDPLPAAALPPEIPQPSSSDLAPFMNSPNSYGW